MGFGLDVFLMQNCVIDSHIPNIDIMETPTHILITQLE